MNQAWLITRIYNENHKVFDTFISLLDASIPSEAIRQITEELYHVLIDSSTHSPSSKSNNAQYRILPDGTPHTGEIYCGHNPGLYARHIYDVIITHDTNQSYILSYREAHMFMQDNALRVEYWEDFSVAMPLTYLSNIDK